MVDKNRWAIINLADDDFPNVMFYSILDLKD